MFDKSQKDFKRIKSKVAKKKEKLDQAQDDRCFPIVELYFDAVMRNEIKLGETTFEEKEEYVKPIVSAVLTACLEDNLKVADMKYIDQLIKKVNGDIMETLFNSVNRSLAICSKDYWGVEDREKDFKLIDDKLKEIVKKQEKKS